MSKPLCFVLLPYGRKRSGSGTSIDFDAVYAELVEPALAACGLEPLRADDEHAVGMLYQPLIERLMLSDYALLDLGAASASAFYQLGLRHALKPAGTALMCAKGAASFGLDATALQALEYEIGADGRPASATRDGGALAERLQGASANLTSSPVYQIVDRFPDIQRLKTDVFRARVDYSRDMKEQLLAARRRGVEALRAIHVDLQRAGNGVAGAPAGVVVDLYLSYRAVKAWDDMIALAGTMAKPLAASPLVREQLALALNRAGRGEQAQRVIEQLLAERGPSSETCSILGRVYKDRWEQALAAGERDAARDLLARAIDAYLQGFDSDWRDAYPGVNAVVLMELADPPDARRAKLIPVVAYAVERRIAGGLADYWDHASRIELAVLAGDEPAAAAALESALDAVREAWEPESTARNLRLVRRAREARGDALPWALAIEQQLDARARARGA